MNFVSVRIITDNFEPLVAFYERITATTARRYTPDFAEVATASSTIAIAHSRTLELFGGAIATPASNQAVIIELRVDDVDAEFRRLAPMLERIVQEPTTMPWGNRSLLFRDPDGTLVNFFTPPASR